MTSNQAWDMVLNVRQDYRVKGLDIVEALFTDFIELHGDRAAGDDKAIICGLAKFHDIPITVIAQHKGNGMEDKINRNYGMPLPEGYRKSLRLMKQADKFGRPIVCIIDTPGAYPGIDAEERGQAEAIARNLYEMSLIKVPIISIIIGEGGSGGALALAVANKILMFENAVFSVISAEGCASILWKDSQKAPEAAKCLKITASDLFNMGIVDEVIKENKSFDIVIRNLNQSIKSSLALLMRKSGDDLKNERNKKYRNIGI